VYREKFPELLHKRDRGKAASIQLGAGGGDAGLARRPAAYGASQVATGVAGRPHARLRLARQPPRAPRAHATRSAPPRAKTPR
jgi:hypothetical protein